MARIRALALLLMSCMGCGRVLVKSGDDLDLSKATLVIVGVVEEFEIEKWPWFRVDVAGEYWKVIRRRVRVENVLVGTEARPVIDVYEASWMGGASGDWNVVRPGTRAVFPLIVVEGLYRPVRDWRRSIFPVSTGAKPRGLPLDGTRPLWERIALMNWRIDGVGPAGGFSVSHLDPARVLDWWRVVKLERGLMRHPNSGVRVSACRELLYTTMLQDECWDQLADGERQQLLDAHAMARADREKKTGLGRDAARWWAHFRGERDSRRLLTTMNDAKMRREFCRLYEAEYPGDRDNGCPADRPPPATIVTEAGDVPLVGPWPAVR